MKSQDIKQTIGALLLIAAFLGTLALLIAATDTYFHPHGYGYICKAYKGGESGLYTSTYRRKYRFKIQGEKVTKAEFYSCTKVDLPNNGSEDSFIKLVFINITRGTFLK